MRLLAHERDASLEAAGAQRLGAARACETRSDDEHVVVHYAAFLFDHGDCAHRARGRGVQHARIGARGDGDGDPVLEPESICSLVDAGAEARAERTVDFDSVEGHADVLLGCGVNGGASARQATAPVTEPTAAR